MSEHIVTEIIDAVMRIEIRRPEKRNAMNFAMYAGLRDILLAADRDSAVRVVLICGQPDGFCAGNDMQGFLEPTAVQADSPVLSFMQTMAAVEKPLVAAVAGNAVGVGTTMLLQCDLVYAAHSARFQMPFVPLGICPEFGSSLLLPRRVGYQRAAELLFFGDAFGAEEAREVGLVNTVCGEEELAGLALSRARQLAQLPQTALRQTKCLMRRRDADLLQDVIAEEYGQMLELVQTEEAREAFGRFIRRRTPATA